MQKIRTGDTVVMIRGKDRGKTGAVLRVLLADGLVVVEGLNLRIKHVKPRRQGEKGQRVQIPRSIPVSNVKIVCKRCGHGVRVGMNVDEKGKRTRVCKECRETLSS